MKNCLLTPLVLMLASCFPEAPGEAVADPERYHGCFAHKGLNIRVDPGRVTILGQESPSQILEGKHFYFAYVEPVWLSRGNKGGYSLVRYKGVGTMLTYSDTANSLFVPVQQGGLVEFKRRECLQQTLEIR